MMQNFSKFYENFAKFMSEFNLKNSYIKEQILSILYKSDEHLSAQEIKDEFNKIYKQDVSLPTIYGLLNFLSECSFTNQYEEDGTAKYELNLKPHHDHLICEKCGKVVSFRDEIIERRQDEICENLYFTPTAHTMLLYGICERCGKAD